VTIPAKVNAVSVDGCARAGVSLVGAVAAVELVNCRRLTLHVSGRAPSIAVDKCAGVTLVLDGGGEGVDVTTAMSTEVNIVLPPAPGAPADADPVELAVPEQFVTRVVGGRLVTAPVAHSGA
jgi:adenylyl cyclase-associated protein